MSEKQKVVAIIPARIESTRLPGKALLDICGLPMIVHVFKRCMLSKSLDEVYVATDSIEIKEVVKNFGGKVIMTSSKHETGTDRIAEVALKLDVDIIVNVQGDEALVNPDYIDRVTNEMIQNPDINVGLLVNPFSKKNSPSDIKVVLNKNNDVMYLSRSDIPSDSRVESPSMLKAYHIVPFRKNFLLEFAQWNKGILEKIEFNEYLRILENGERIRAVHVESAAISVDTQEDLEYVRKKMPEDFYYQQYVTNS
jgi:3-deoxy-manno-octulosonate cytidylyltransferase (CMP-KDO synthetase)